MSDSPDPHAAREALTTLLKRLIEAALLQDGPEADAALRAASDARTAFAAAARGVAEADLHLEGAWARAVRDAETPGFNEKAHRASLTLPSACPLGVTELAAPETVIADLAQQLRWSAGTG